MKAAFKQGDRVFLKDIALRPVGPDEIRMRIEACGICGTDLLRAPGDEKYESGLGHEVAGEVIETGAAVTNVAVGRKIVLESSSACGQCANCRNMRQELCTDWRSFGRIKQVGMAEEMLSPAISAVPYEGLTPEVACLSEPLGVAIDMVRLAEIAPTSNVLITGAGPIGLMALALVKRMGARRVFYSAFAAEKARVAVARRFGADVVIDPSVTPLEKHDFGCALDRALVTTPPATLPGVCQALGKGGIVSFIGIQWGDGTYATFDINAFHFKKLQLRASFASPALLTPLALQYLREKIVDGEALISHRFPLNKAPEAMAAAADRASAVKVVVTGING
jgi:L-iditol 2-dehydrogenase